VKEYQDRAEATKKNMKLEQVLDPDEALQKPVLLAGDVDHHSKKNHQSAQYSQSMTIVTRGFEPVVLRVVKALFNWKFVVGVAYIREVNSDRHHNGDHRPNVYLMSDFVHPGFSI